MSSHRSEADERYSQERAELIARLRARQIAPDDVLDAMLIVPREQFLQPELRELAYDDNALPIAEGQTISQPTIVAMMTAALNVTPESKVLEIGTGSGYQAAILAQLAGEVVSIEFYPSLAEQARQMLARLGVANVEVHAGDGSMGWPAAAPYDRILITAAAPFIASTLLSQLRERPGSRLVAPIGDQESQELVVVEWTDGEWVERRGGQVRFVPLRGEAGWSDTGWSKRWKPFAGKGRKRNHQP